MSPFMNVFRLFEIMHMSIEHALHVCVHYYPGEFVNMDARYGAQFPVYTQAA